MTRPRKPAPLPSPRTRSIRVRVTDAERERWGEAAKRDRRTLSDWIRLVADAASGAGS